MTQSINSDLVVAYSQCPRKAFLSLSGNDKRTPHDFVRILNETARMRRIHYIKALKRDGTLWAWGRNIFGQLGDGTFIDKSIPVQIGSDYTSISAPANGTFSLAIKTNGTLWAWGNSYYGALGDGTTEIRNTPVQVASGF